MSGTSHLSGGHSLEKKLKSKKKPPLFRKINSEDFAEIYHTRKLYLGIWRHLFLILICMIIWGVLGVFASHKFLYTYEAEAVVLYQDEEDTSKTLEGGFTLTNLTLATMLDLIKTPKHFEAVKIQLGLDLDPEAIGRMIKIPTPRSDSNVIRIIARGSNSNLVVDIANTLAKVAVKDSKDFTRKQLRTALDNYRSQLGVVQRALASQIEDIGVFKSVNKFFEMDPRSSLIIQKVEDARKTKETADLNYEGLLVQFQNLKKEVDLLPDVIPINRNSQNSPLKLRIISLETELAQVRARYTSDNPKVLQIQQELNELNRKGKSNEKLTEEEEFFERNALKDSLSLELLHMQGKVHSAYKVKEEVNNNLVNVETKLQTLPVKQMEFLKLLESKNLIEEQVRFMAKAAEVTQLMVNIPKGSIELYQLAQKASPWKDSWWVEFLPIIAGIFGLGFGVFLALFIETQDRKIRTPKQVSMYYRLECLGVIPELKSLKPYYAKDRMLFFTRQLSETVDRLIVKDQGYSHSIACVSSFDGEGKSTISYLLSDYRAKIGEKVLYMGMDWRKNSYSEKTEEKGLVDYLDGKASMEEIITKGSFDRIKLGSRDHRMKELIKSSQMHTLWNALKKNYDVIIFDTPGVIQEDYASNIVELADRSILIVGSSHVKKSSVDETLHVLDKVGARPEGILLNRVDPIYIDDERIKLETRRSNRGLIKQFFGFGRWGKK